MTTYEIQVFEDNAWKAIFSCYSELQTAEYLKQLQVNNPDKQYKLVVNE